MVINALGQTVTWSDPIVVNEDTKLGYTRPKIALTKNNVPVVMWGRSPNQEVFVSRLNNGDFGTPVKVTPEGVKAFVQFWAGPGLDANGNQVFVSFKSQPEDEGYVYTVRSSDGGITFGDTVRVSDNRWSRFPEVSVSPDGNPAVTFMEFEPDFKEPHYAVARSSDQGVSYGASISATKGAPGEACDCCPGFILADEERIVVMFRNNDNDLRDIWASVSTDNGKTFNTIEDIDLTNWVIGGCPSTGPEAIIDGDSLVSVWMSGATGSSKINIGTADLKKLDIGINEELTPTLDRNQNYPKIAGDSTFIAVTWQEIENGNRNIKCIWTTRGASGLVGRKPFQVNVNTFGAQQSPDMIYADGKLHVVWQDLTGRKVMYRQARIDVVGDKSMELDDLEISVYPNPVKRGFFIERAQIENKVMHVVLTDVQGSEVVNLSSASNKVYLSTEGYSSGLYFLNIRIDGVTQKRKIYIE
jgi:hypothetical protein